MLEPVAQQRAIGEARQGILERLTPELLFEVALLGDVAVIDGNAANRRIADEVLAERRDPPPGPVGMEIPALGRCLGPIGLQHLLESCLHGWKVVGMDTGEGIGPHTIDRPESERALDRRALVQDFAAGRHDRKHIGRVLHEGAKPALYAEL